MTKTSYYFILTNSFDNLSGFEMASNSTAHHSGNSSPPFIKKDGKSMIIPSKNLNIVWGKDGRYWNVPENKDLPVELYQVCWLEITGSVDKSDPHKNYEVGFEVSLNPDAFGWGKYPIYVMVKKGKKGKIVWTKTSIDPNKKGKFVISGKSDPQDVGNSDDPKLYFGLYEVWSGKWKGGLTIHHALITEN